MITFSLLACREEVVSVLALGYPDDDGPGEDDGMACAVPATASWVTYSLFVCFAGKDVVVVVEVLAALPAGMSVNAVVGADVGNVGVTEDADETDAKDAVPFIAKEGVTA